MHISIYIYSRVYLDDQFQEAIRIEALINKKIQEAGVKSGVITIKKSIASRTHCLAQNADSNIFVEAKLKVNSELEMETEKEKGRLVLIAIQEALKESGKLFDINVADLYPFRPERKSPIRKLVEVVKKAPKQMFGKKEKIPEGGA